MYKQKKELLIQLHSLVSFIEYQQQGIFSAQQDKALERLKSQLSDEDWMFLFHFTSTWRDVAKFFPQDKYKAKIEIINNLYESLPKKTTSLSQYPPEKPLIEQSTRQLKAKRCFRWDTKEQVEIREILKSREHVLTSSQSRLVRKMSIHAGKKLTLKEAQDLRNKLKRKS